jgi:leader peptidase (prepilin peptidase) / N-methyltransferase
MKYWLNGGTAALMALATWRIGPEPVLPAVLAFIFGGVLLAVIDWKYHLLPRKYVYRTLAGVSAGLVFAALVSGDWTSLLTATVGAALLANAFGLVYYGSNRFLKMKIIGYGDVRLALVLGALLGWFGIDYLITGMVVALFVAFPFAAVKLAQTRKLNVNMAFGPPLMLGTLLVILAHA